MTPPTRISRPSLLILKRARKRLASPDAWTKDWEARHFDGEPVSYDDPGASCWCAAGAIAKAAPSVKARHAAFEVLAMALGFSVPIRIVKWNNAKCRTHDDVLAAFDRAIALAEGRHS